MVQVAEMPRLVEEESPKLIEIPEFTERTSIAHAIEAGTVDQDGGLEKRRSRGAFEASETFEVIPRCESQDLIEDPPVRIENDRAEIVSRDPRVECPVLFRYVHRKL